MIKTKNQLINLILIYFMIFMGIMGLIISVDGPLYQTNTYHSFLVITAGIMFFGFFILIFYSIYKSKDLTFEIEESKRSKNFTPSKNHYTKEEFAKLQKKYQSKEHSHTRYGLTDFWGQRMTKFLIISLILLFTFFYLVKPMVLPLYISQTSNQLEKDQKTIEFIKDKIEYIEPSFNTQVFELLTDKIIRTNEGVYELISSIDSKSITYKKYQILKFEDINIDSKTFKVAEPIIIDNYNPFLRPKEELYYYRYYMPGGRHNRGRYHYLENEKYLYKYFSDKNQVYFIDKETMDEKQSRIFKENNETIENLGYNILHQATRLNIRILQNATPNNWELLNKYYSKSENYVYYNGKILISYKNKTKTYADPKTFEIIGENSGQDKNGIWSNGILLD